MLQQKLVSADELQEMLDDQKREPPGSRLASTAARKGRLTMLDALSALAQQHGVPAVDLTEEIVALGVLRLIPAEMAREHAVFPFRLEGEELHLAMSSPDRREVIEELEFVTGKRIIPHVALDHVLRVVVEYAYAALHKGGEYYVGAHVSAEQLEAQQLPDLPRAPEPLSDPPPPPPPSEVLNLDPRSLGEQLDAAFAQRMAPSQPPVVPAPAEGARVLVAVRDPALRVHLVEQLGATGVSVLQTEDGQQALDMLRADEPQLLVVEAMLTSVHGLDICRRLRASPRYAELPILVLCDAFGGWRMARDLHANYGIQHCFEPPFDIAKLVRTAQLLLDGQASATFSLPPLAHAAEAKWNAGMAAFERGDIEAAVIELEAAANLDPRAFELQFHLGLLYGRRDDLFAAIRALEHAVHLQPAHFPAIKNLAVVYQRAGFRHKAIDAWERAMTAAPDDETRANIKEHMVSLL
jgi:DNA-binding response OmpR family regulator